MRGREIILPLKLFSMQYFDKENKTTKKIKILSIKYKFFNYD